MPVLGIGGLFFRSRDPDALSAWYRDHLGIGAGCVAEGAGNADQWVWQTVGGPVVFAPFRDTTDYFAADKEWMLNLRVSGLDALVDTLAAKGVVAERRADWDSPDVGRFARIHDPEGNAIELWEQPAG